MLRAPLSLSSTYGCNLLSRLPGEAAELLAWPPTVCRQTTSWGYYALWDIVHPKMNISTYFLPFVSFQTIVEHKQRLWLSGSKKHQRRTMKVVQVFRSHMSYLWRFFFFLSFWLIDLGCCSLSLFTIERKNRAEESKWVWNDLRVS